MSGTQILHFRWLTTFPRWRFHRSSRIFERFNNAYALLL